MSELSLYEFVTELIIELGERVEGNFTDDEEARLREALTEASERLEREDT